MIHAAICFDSSRSGTASSTKPVSIAPSPNQMMKKEGRASSSSTSAMPAISQCHHSRNIVSFMTRL
jgi:hypothetical protein